MSRFEERVFGWLLRAYPAEFRRHYGDDLVAFFREDRRNPRYGAGPGRVVRFWAATMRDLVHAAAEARRADRRARLHLHQGVSMQTTARPTGLSRHRLADDLRIAVRSLRATPGSTTVALLVLVLGVGASTAIFAVGDAVALRALPFPEPHTLVSVAETDLETGRPVTVAAPNLLEWSARQDVLESLAASSFTRLVMKDGARGERLLAVAVTPNLFGVLGATPALGRLFADADAVAGQDDVVLLTDGAWRRRFGADPAVIGRSLAFEDGARRVVGVMPPGFVYPLGSRFVRSAELWIPKVFTERDRARDGGRTYDLQVIGRLAPGVSLDEARAQFTVLRDSLALAHPRWFEDRGVTVRPLRDAVVAADVRAWMILLLWAVAFVLVIACANVANVLLTRATTRSREVGIRAALGATRWDLVRAAMVESVVLGAAGAAGGLLLAQAAVGVLGASLPAQLPRITAIAIDARVLAAAAAAGLASGLLVGVLPALRISRPDLAGALREQGRANTASAGAERVRSALVVAEVGLAIVLLVGAGLFTASFVRLLQRDLGFDPSNVATVGVSMPRAPSGAMIDRSAPPAVAVGLPAMLDRLAAIPGVEHVSAVTTLPLSGNWRTSPMTVVGRQSDGETPDEVAIREATPGFLDVMRLRLRSGRWFTEADSATAPPVIVLGEEAVRQFFSRADPLGADVSVDEQTRRVVGVVAATQFRGPEVEAIPEAYLPLPQARFSSVDLAVRSSAPLASIGPALRDAAWQTIPNAIVSEPRTIASLFGDLVAQRRFNALLVAVFGALALTIVTVGIYGVMGCVVDQRTQEIGVRMALGAQARGMLIMVLRRAAGLTAAGLVVGLLAAAAFEQVMFAFLFEPRPHDPVVYGLTAAVVIVVTLVAAAVPARRAASVDPLIALRAN
jgi:putative ABC transport system permease protein